MVVEENCVGPLYEQVFAPALAPTLSFVGLPKKVDTYPDVLISHCSSPRYVGLMHSLFLIGNIHFECAWQDL